MIVGKFFCGGEKGRLAVGLQIDFLKTNLKNFPSQKTLKKPQNPHSNSISISSQKEFLIHCLKFRVVIYDILYKSDTRALKIK